MLTIVAIIASFIGVAALVGGVAMYVRRDVAGTLEDRLDILAGAKTAPNAAGRQLDASVLASPLEETRGQLEQLLSRLGNSKRFLEQADSPFDASRLFMICVMLASTGVVIAVVVPAVPMVMAPALAAGLGICPLFWLSFRRKRRLKKFGKQLPEALELISRALRAGHSLASGISLVAEEMPDPIRKEFQRCYESQNLGVPLEEALEEMSVRVPNLDLRFFVTAVTLQRQTGGDLAEILDKIGSLVRERFKIWGQIQALTGEGRLSGIILLALPPALFVVTYRLNPDYCTVLFTEPMGRHMLIGAIVMQILGALVIRKIVDIKV